MTELVEEAIWKRDGRARWATRKDPATERWPAKDGSTRSDRCPPAWLRQEHWFLVAPLVSFDKGIKILETPLSKGTRSH
jgi:hypothetical protein